VSLRAVRRWAGERGITRATFARAYDDALLVAVSRLLEAIHREGHAPHSTLREDARGRWFLDVGRPPTLQAPVTGPLPFGRFGVTGFPSTIGADGRRTVRTPGAFLSALRRGLEGSDIIRHYGRLVVDFHNSFANLVLNRLLGERLDADAPAIEPVYEGHHYYPLPALRIGPTVANVVECSNLCREAIDLRMAVVHPGRFASVDFADQRACFEAWANIPLPSDPGVVIPLHPWQISLSPIVGALLERGWIAILDARLKAVPLASQRTCRIVGTGFDVKLPIDATLTAEHRLLYPINRANAPTVSALARRVLEASGERTLDFQRDVATMAHADSRIAPHLSVIVRSPVPQRAGEVVIPALNLWSELRRADTLASVHDSQLAYGFFRAYCRVLMKGPVEFCTRWGLAFEPHLQNVSIAFRDGMPVRMVLRDLDGTILDPVRIRPLVQVHRLRLASATWRHMPRFEVGGQRLVHAMLYGHLGAVMSYLVRSVRADLGTLLAAVAEVWSELIAEASSAACRRSVRELRAQSHAVKGMLRTRLERSTRIAFGGETDGPVVRRPGSAACRCP
jgi:siderophore synthetase component